jgi:predicted DNA-binding transcriptional regulator YafY
LNCPALQNEVDELQAFIDAAENEKVQFHLSQKISHGRNGSLVIEMRCSGHRELIWELLHPDWIGHVKIESPEGLQKEYLGQLERAKLAVFSE